MSLSHTSADSHEIRGLTGIRGFAAVLVVAFHFYGSWLLLLPSLHVLGAPVSHGYLGVDLFFILSGFILSYVYNVRNRKLTLPEYGKFLWFRLARVYPNHLATLLVLVFLVLLAPRVGLNLSGMYSLGNLPYQLTLTQSWPIDPRQTGGDWNFPAWSISAEWFAYLAVFPVVAFLLPRMRHSVLALCLGTSALVAWELYYYVLLPEHLKHAAYHGLMHVSCEFFAGGMFFCLFLLGGRLVRFCQHYLSGLFAILFVLFFCPQSPWLECAILLLFALLLLGLTSEVSIAARVLATPPALWLGRLSYALYMSHAIAEKFIKIVLPPEHYVHSSLALRSLVFFAHLTIIFVMMTGLYYLVEIPARNYLRHFWSSRKGVSL